VYLGFTEEAAEPSVVTSHSVPLLEDDFDVIFSPELLDASAGLVAGLKNKVYF
jgi:hypothetical protein